MIGAGLVLGSLAGLELAVREHFAGYRSHTLLLAGAIGVAVVAGLYVTGGDRSRAIALLAGVVVFAAFVWPSPRPSAGAPAGRSFASRAGRDRPAPCARRPQPAVRLGLTASLRLQRPDQEPR